MEYTGSRESLRYVGFSIATGQGSNAEARTVLGQQGSEGYIPLDNLLSSQDDDPVYGVLRSVLKSTVDKRITTFPAKPLPETLPVLKRR